MFKFALLFLISFNVLALSSSPTCNRVVWVEPTEYKFTGASILAKDNLHYKIYLDGRVYRSNGQNINKYKAGTTSAYFSSKTCPACVQVSSNTVNGGELKETISECAK